MKKTMLSMVCAVAAGAAFAAANDLLISFSTPGPDKYADGSTVLDGERYALCWSTNFSQFAIKADGTAVGGKVVVSAPVAKGGRCPSVVYEVDAEYAKQFSGGEWSVYLLDTRTFAKDGVALGSRVNTVGYVGGASLGQGTVANIAAGAAASTAALASGVEVPTPEITGIRVFEGNVYVTVTGTVPYLAYGLASGATPDDVSADVGAAAPGKVDADEEVTLIAPAKEGGAFFKAGRR